MRLLSKVRKHVWKCESLLPLFLIEAQDPPSSDRSTGPDTHLNGIGSVSMCAGEENLRRETQNSPPGLATKIPLILMLGKVL